MENEMTTPNKIGTTLIAVFSMVAIGLAIGYFLYQAPEPLPSIEQIKDMEQRCGKFGYSAQAIANAFKQVTTVECIDKLGNHISVKPDSRITIK